MDEGDEGPGSRLTMHATHGLRVSWLELIQLVQIFCLQFSGCHFLRPPVTAYRAI